MAAQDKSLESPKAEFGCATATFFIVKAKAFAKITLMAKTIIYNPTRLGSDPQYQSQPRSVGPVAFLVKVLGGLSFDD
jgi:hypothetical protein